VALTDHDTTAGLAPARMESSRWGVDVVAGVELGATDEGCEVHLLGYFIEAGEPRFAVALADLRRDRELRMANMVERCQTLGLAVGMADVRAQANGQSVGRPHLAAALVARGLVSTMGEAFARYIGDGREANVSRHIPSSEQAIDLIHGARGLAVLAHPGLEVDSGTVARLVRAGLDGIEVWHPRHDPLTVVELLALATDLGLVATGGSDFHGMRDTDELGSPPVEDAVLETLEAARAARLATSA
jgi:predicted metal-dependent phosphoesterase TrpH